MKISVNRKYDKDYKRTESYLTDDTRKRMNEMKGLLNMSISEFIELLIEEEYKKFKEWEEVKK